MKIYKRNLRSLVRSNKRFYTFLDLNHIVSMEFDVNKHKNINFLIEYSDFLIKTKKFDESIINWQIENSFPLRSLGLDTEFLKKKMKEKNKDYYKFPNLISQLSCKYALTFLDRLDKHNKLAPAKEIVRKMDIDEIDENEEGEGQNLNEMNYYDANDTFIDDEDVCSDNSENEFTKISLPYENYTEEAILNNLLKADKIREKEESRRKKKKEFRMKKQDENKNKNMIDKSLDKNSDYMNIDHVSPKNQKVGEEKKENNHDINKKRKKIVNFVDSEKKKELNNTQNTNELNELNINNQNKQFSQIDSDLENLQSTFSLENVQKDSKDKLMFLKKISVIYRKINGQINIEYFLEKISFLFNTSTDLLQLILEFDKLKVKRDGIYSTIAKLIMKLEYKITEIGIKDITDCGIFKSNEEIGDKLDQILERILNYLKINDMVSTYLKTEENESKIKQFLETNKLGNMSDSEAKAKIIHKFKETLEKASIVFNLENFLQIINTYIKEQEKSSIGDKYMFDINLRFIGEEGMPIDDPEPKNDNKNNSKNSDDEVNNNKIITQENDSKRKISFKNDETEEKIKTNENEIIDLENSNIDINMDAKEPSLSKRFYKVM